MLSFNLDFFLQIVKQFNCSNYKLIKYKFIYNFFIVHFQVDCVFSTLPKFRSDLGLSISVNFVQ